MTTTSKREQFNVFQLAGMAECSSPDSADSAGAKFLLSVQSELDDRFEHDPESFLNDDAHDAIHEVADNAPNIYTANRWAEFVDLAAYQEDISEFMPSVDPDAGGLEAAAGVALYIIAERLCYALVEVWKDAAEEEEEEESEEVAP